MIKLKPTLSGGLVALALCVCGQSDAAEYYTWVDENGVTNYAERQQIGRAHV